MRLKIFFQNPRHPSHPSLTISSDHSLNRTLQTEPLRRRTTTSVPYLNHLSAHTPPDPFDEPACTPKHTHSSSSPALWSLSGSGSLRTMDSDVPKRLWTAHNLGAVGPEPPPSPQKIKPMAAPLKTHKTSSSGGFSAFVYLSEGKKKKTARTRGPAWLLSCLPLTPSPPSVHTIHSINDVIRRHPQMPGLS